MTDLRLGSLEGKLETLRADISSQLKNSKLPEPLCSGDESTISWYNAPKKIWKPSDVRKVAPPPPSYPIENVWEKF